MTLTDTQALAVGGQHRWENEPVPDWTVDDLDASEITRTIDEAIRRQRAEDPGTRDPTELLRGLGLTRGGRLLRAAVVLFGRSERAGAEYPQCMLRVARFRGTARTDEFLDNRQFHGNAFTLLGSAERFFRENLPIAGRIEADRFERVDDPLYPPPALREALANAICHRDYSIGGGSCERWTWLSAGDVAVERAGNADNLRRIPAYSVSFRLIDRLFTPERLGESSYRTDRPQLSESLPGGPILGT